MSDLVPITSAPGNRPPRTEPPQPGPPASREPSLTPITTMPEGRSYMPDPAAIPQQAASLYDRAERAGMDLNKDTEMDKLHASLYLGQMTGQTPDFVYENFDSVMEAWHGEPMEEKTALGAFWSEFKTSFKQLKANSQAFNLIFAEGDMEQYDEYVQYLNTIEPSDMKNLSFYQKIWGSVGTLIPSMGASTLGGIGGAGIAMLASGGFGGSFGFKAGASMVSYKQTAGSIFGEAITTEVPGTGETIYSLFADEPEKQKKVLDIARSIAMIGAAPAAAVEVVKLDALSGGRALGGRINHLSDRIIKGTMSPKNIANRFAAWLVIHGANVLEETGEEIIQELIEMGSVELINEVLNDEEGLDIPAATKEEWADMMKQVFVTTALGVGVIGLPGSISQSLNLGVEDTDTVFNAPNLPDIALDELVPPERIATEAERSHAQSQFDAKRSGQGAVAPIEVWEDEQGNKHVVDGQASYEILQENGFNRANIRIVEKPGVTEVTTDETIVAPEALSRDEFLNREQQKNQRINEIATEENRKSVSQKFKDMAGEAIDLGQEGLDKVMEMVDLFAKYQGVTMDQFIERSFDPTAFVYQEALGENEFGQQNKAGYRRGPDGKAQMIFSQASDVTSFVHEFGHVMSPNLKPEHRSALEAHYGGKMWAGGRMSEGNRAIEERFAEDFEKYIREGKAPTAALAKIFQDLVYLVRKVFQTFDTDLSPEARQVFDEIFTQADANRNVDPGVNNQAQAEAAAHPDLSDGEQVTLHQTVPPYQGNKLTQWVGTLSPEARETYDLMKDVRELTDGVEFEFFIKNKDKIESHTGTDSFAKTVQVHEWNAFIENEKNGALREMMQKVIKRLPADIRTKMRINDDGTLKPTKLESNWKMQRSMFQRMVDALPVTEGSPEYTTDGKTFLVSEASEMQYIGGEQYRRALVKEYRNQYRLGKLRKVKVKTMSQDNWGALGFLQNNGKTIASGDFTTLCPQVFFNEGCFYCYRSAGLKNKVNTKLLAENVWYAGEILRMTGDDVNALNKAGGLRIQSFGDWMPQFEPQLADIMIDAQLRKLQLKVITKEADMIEAIAKLKEQGIGKNLFMHISTDYTMEPVYKEDQSPSTFAKEFAETKENAHADKPMLPMNPDRADSMVEVDGTLYWKRAFSPEEAKVLRDKYPWVNVRVVVDTIPQFIRALENDEIDVVTGYHGDIQNYARVDSETGEVITEVERLGDPGMTRFLPNGEIDPKYPGGNKDERALGQAIYDKKLQEQYWKKTCCITGNCSTCVALCGVERFLNSFDIKNANNRDPGSREYWEENIVLNQTTSPGQEIEMATDREALVADIKKDGTKFDFYAVPERDMAVLARIQVPEDLRGQGVATEAMNKVSVFADKHGLTVQLTPSDSWGSSVAKLKKFYKRFGYVENKGKNKDFEISGTMYREPVSAQLFQTAPPLASEAFKTWFKDSAVVDESGNPLKVFHGTASEFEAFSVDRLGSVTRAKSARHGFFFTPRVEDAQAYARNASWKVYPVSPPARVVEAYLSMQNPLVVDVRDIDGYVSSVTEKMIAGGHDGAIIKGAFDRPQRALVAVGEVELPSIDLNGTMGGDTIPGLLAGMTTAEEAMEEADEYLDYLRDQLETERDQRDEEREYTEEKEVEMRLEELKDWTLLRNALRDNPESVGYSRGPDTPVYVVRDPAQVKSVENQGTWNAEDPRMLFQTAPPVGSGAFQNWFGNSKVVDEDGDPVVMYHGTTHDFEAFDPTIGNPENDFGEGIYLTNEPMDVDRNYAGMGPDLTARVELREEEISQAIMDDPEEFGLPDNIDQKDADKEARKIAEAELVGGEGRVIETYVSLKNPVIIERGESSGTFFDYAEAYDEETDEYGEPEGSLVDLIEVIREEMSEMDGGSAEDLISDILEDAMDDGGMSAADVERMIREAPSTSGMYDYAGEMVNLGAFAKQIFEAAGYDGIIDKTVDTKFGSNRRWGTGMEGMTPDTFHVIAFKPTQVKSIENQGAWNPEDPRLLFQSAEAEKKHVEAVQAAVEEGRPVSDNVLEDYEDQGWAQKELDRRRSLRDEYDWVFEAAKEAESWEGLKKFVSEENPELIVDDMNDEWFQQAWKMAHVDSRRKANKAFLKSLSEDEPIRQMLRDTNNAFDQMKGLGIHPTVLAAMKRGFPKMNAEIAGLRTIIARHPEIYRKAWAIATNDTEALTALQYEHDTAIIEVDSVREEGKTRDRMSLAAKIDDKELRRRVLAGDISSKELEALSTAYRSELSKLETENAKNALKVANRDASIANRRIRDYIKLLGKRITSSRGVGKTIDLETRKLIEAVQDQVDPNFRSKKTLSLRKEQRDAIAANPALAEVIDPKGIAFQKSLNELTVAELEELADIVKALKAIGRATQMAKDEAKKVRRELAAANGTREVLAGEDPSEFSATGSQEFEEERKTGFVGQVKAASMRPSRVIRMLFGDDGSMYDWFIRKVRKARDAMLKKTSSRHDAGVAKMKELGITGKRLGDDLVVDGMTFSRDQVIGIDILMKNRRSRAAILHGNSLTFPQVVKLTGMLSNSDKAWGKWMMTDFDNNYDRLRNAYVENTNEEMGREVNYFPMSRLGKNFDNLDQEIADQMLTRNAWKTGFVDKKNTIARIEISDEHQTAIRLDATAIWLQQIEKQEHYINSGTLVMDLHSIRSKDNLTNAVRQKYGDRYNKWLEKYVNDFATPNIYKSHDATSQMFSKLRRNYALAALSGNLLTIAKQAPSITLFLSKVGPMKLMAAVGQVMTDRKKWEAFVNERDPQMYDRAMTRFLEEMKAAELGAKGIPRKIAEMGMRPIQWVDKTVTTMGWLAVYNDKLSQGFTEEQAIEAAQAAVLETQPAARAEEVAEMYRSGEGLNWFLMFTNQINQIWNLVMFDLPHALKVGQVREAAGIAAGTMIGFATMALMSGWRLPEDEEDVPIEVTREFVKQFVNTIPLVGGVISSGMSRWGASGVQPFPLAEQIGEMSAFLFKDDKTEAQFVKRLEGLAKGAGMMAGIPTVETFRILKAFETGGEVGVGKAFLELFGPAFKEEIGR